MMGTTVLLNVNWWNRNNCELRQIKLHSTNADLKAVNETHLKNNECPKLTGYNWVGANRLTTHKNAVRAFSGIGLFHKDELAHTFQINIIDKTFDGILNVLFTHKHTEYKLVTCVCYLLPEDSR